MHLLQRYMPVFKDGFGDGNRTILDGMDVDEVHVCEICTIQRSSYLLSQIRDISLNVDKSCTDCLLCLFPVGNDRGIEDVRVAVLFVNLLDGQG